MIRILLLTFLFPLLADAQQIEIFAGDTLPGYKNGPLGQALFNGPFGLCTDKEGNIYLADTGNDAIRKISASGIVSSLTGTGEASQPMLKNPSGVCTDNMGNIYIAGFGDNRIWKISTKGMITTIAGNGNYGFKDGKGVDAEFRSPRGICMDEKGDLVGDCWNHRIRKIGTDGSVTTYAGDGYYSTDDNGGYRDGDALLVRFNAPCGVAIDQEGNIYVADANNHCIRKIGKNRHVSTVAGAANQERGKGKGGYLDGPCEISLLNTPTELFVDRIGDIYFSDTYNNSVRKISISREVTTIAGNPKNNCMNNATFDYPRGIIKLGGYILVLGAT